MKVEGLRYRDEWIPNFYPARKVAEDNFLRLSRVGSTQILSEAQNAQLDEVAMDAELFERLERTCHIITSQNSAEVFERLEEWHALTYCGPRLHIIVLTKRCNLNCTYCHMNPEAIGADPAAFDMQPDTMDATIEFSLSTPSSHIHFEFQGGEPFLNFEGMKYFVTKAREANESVGKNLHFSVVSNLMLVKDEHLEFCREQGINVSYSLNGPEDLHDLYRKSRTGSGSWRIVMKRLRTLQERFPGVLSTSPLCVVGADNAKDLIRTIDFYHEEGFKGVAILKLKHLGNSVKENLAFDIDEFLKYYLAALDHIYYKNIRTGENYSERHLRVLVAKTMSDRDIGYIDWRNPNGDFSGAVTIDHDGEILPSDEARSLRHFWGLGNVKERSYEELVRDPATLRSMNLSLRDRDPECRECAFNPYCGLLPVLDYARTGDPVPKPHASEECLQTIAVLEWLFEKMVEDPLPLFRMLPGMDRHLVKLAERLEVA